jgi:hypothetical protein
VDAWYREVLAGRADPVTAGAAAQAGIPPPGAQQPEQGLLPDAGGLGGGQAGPAYQNQGAEPTPYSTAAAPGSRIQSLTPAHGGSMGPAEPAGLLPNPDRPFTAADRPDLELAISAKRAQGYDRFALENLKADRRMGLEDVRQSGANARTDKRIDAKAAEGDANRTFQREKLDAYMVNEDSKRKNQMAMLLKRLTDMERIAKSKSSDQLSSDKIRALASMKNALVAANSRVMAAQASINQDPTGAMEYMNAQAEYDALVRELEHQIGQSHISTGTMHTPAPGSSGSGGSSSSSTTTTSPRYPVSEGSGINGAPPLNTSTEVRPPSYDELRSLWGR